MLCCLKYRLLVISLCSNSLLSELMLSLSKSCLAVPVTVVTHLDGVTISNDLAVAAGDAFWVLRVLFVAFC